MLQVIEDGVREAQRASLYQDTKNKTQIYYEIASQKRKRGIKEGN